MENKNGQPERNVPDGVWFWSDDNTMISHSSGMLLVSLAQWVRLTDDIRTKFRPVDIRAGMIGKGLLVGNMLLVFLG